MSLRYDGGRAIRALCHEWQSIEPRNANEEYDEFAVRSPVSIRRFVCGCYRSPLGTRTFTIYTTGRRIWRETASVYLRSDRRTNFCLNNAVPEGVNGLCYYASSINSPLFSRRWSLRASAAAKRDNDEERRDRGSYFVRFFLRPIFPHPSLSLSLPIWPPSTMREYNGTHTHTPRTCIFACDSCMCAFGG